MFTVGLTFGSLYVAVFVHMVLVYPGGRMPTLGQRRLVAAVYAASVIAVLVVLVRRRRAASAPQRRAMAPVLWSGVVLLDLLGLSLIADSAGIDPLSNLLSLLGTLPLLVLPWSYLFGLLRSRVSRAAAVDDVLTRIGESPGTGRLRDLLADALGDPSLELVYRLESEDRWVDTCTTAPSSAWSASRSRCALPRRDGTAVVEITDDGVGGRRSAARNGPARPRRPRCGARRIAGARVRARAGNVPTGGDPGMTAPVRVVLADDPCCCARASRGCSRTPASRLRASPATART